MIGLQTPSRDAPTVKDLEDNRMIKNIPLNERTKYKRVLEGLAVPNFPIELFARTAREGWAAWGNEVQIKKGSNTEQAGYILKRRPADSIKDLEAINDKQIRS